MRGTQNKSLLQESALNNNYSSLRTPTYPTKSEKIMFEKKPAYKFFEKKLIDSLNNEENIYYELNDSDLIDFHETLLNPNKNTSKTQAHQYSTLIDWTKIIQKASIPPEKLIESNTQASYDAIQEVFKAILCLKERNWYDEIAQLYKVSKNCLSIFYFFSNFYYDRRKTLPNSIKICLE